MFNVLLKDVMWLYSTDKNFILPIYNIDDHNFIDLKNNADITLINNNIIKTFEKLYKVNNLKLLSNTELCLNYNKINSSLNLNQLSQTYVANKFNLIKFQNLVKQVIQYSNNFEQNIEKK